MSWHHDPRYGWSDPDCPAELDEATPLFDEARAAVAGDVQSAVFRESGPEQWATDTDLDAMARSGKPTLRALDALSEQLDRIAKDIAEIRAGLG